MTTRRAFGTSLVANSNLSNTSGAAALNRPPELLKGTAGASSRDFENDSALAAKLLGTSAKQQSQGQASRSSKGPGDSSGKRDKKGEEVTGLSVNFSALSLKQRSSSSSASSASSSLVKPSLSGKAKSSLRLPPPSSLAASSSSLLGKSLVIDQATAVPKPSQKLADLRNSVLAAASASEPTSHEDIEVEYMPQSALDAVSDMDLDNFIEDALNKIPQQDQINLDDLEDMAMEFAPIDINADWLS